MEILMRYKPLIVVVDDNQTLLQQLASALEEAGYEVMTAREGQEALDKIEELEYLEGRKPDLVLLDMLMPGGLGGKRTATLLRNRYPPGELAIIVMTEPAIGDEYDMLELGVDDFINKATWSMKVLLARIKKRLPKQKTAKKLLCDDLEVHLDFRQAKLRGQALKLSPLEAKLLIYLMQHPHKDIHYNKILEQVWPDMHGASKNQVQIAISRLRKALQDHDTLIDTGRGYGTYRWIKDVTSVD
jgi:two-component system, OmpR family, phosphate regulon response regulator PhoB